MIGVTLSALTLFAGGCFGRVPFSCVDDAQCDRAPQGRCEDTNACSYPSDDCPSGRRYDRLADNGLAGRCVDPESSDGNASSTGGTCLACVDRDGDSYGDGTACLGADCDDNNPSRSQGCKYIGPGGSDAAAGTESDPWLRFDHALKELQPGDSLILLDGEYTPETTGMLTVDCDDHATSGTADAPISIAAAHERQAHLISDGSLSAVRIKDCAYWRFSGLRARATDNAEVQPAVMTIANSSQLALRRLLLSHNNRHGGTLAWVTDSRDVVLEDSEAYAFTGTALNIGAQQVTIRRWYLHPQGYENLPGCGSDAGSPPCRTPLGLQVTGSGQIIENVIVEGATTGINFHADDSALLGSIFADAASHGVFGGPVAPAMYSNVTFRDIIVADAGENGIFLKSPVSATLEGITVLGSSWSGFLIREDTTAMCPDATPCTLDARHILCLDNGSPGVSGFAPIQWTVEHSNAAGNQDGEPAQQYGTDEAIDDDAGQVRNSTIEPVPEIGRGVNQCLVYVPAESPMHGRGLNGADIGANVLYRYESGVLTDTPLWDPNTGAFDCGEPVSGLSDDPTRSCSGVHTRLNVNANGCSLPAMDPDPACR